MTNVFPARIPSVRRGLPTTIFQNFFQDIDPIRFREPLAETLGAFQSGGAVLEYSVTDVFKMAGHACPTVSGAFLICAEAMIALYPDSVPVRGEIGVSVHGEPDESVYGVMGQVMTYLTGAAPLTGFKGLGHRFKRKDLLRYLPASSKPPGPAFTFERLDTGAKVRVQFIPALVPFPEEKSKQLGGLLEKVVWEAATEDDLRRFQDLWMEKIRVMLVERKDIERWLSVQTIDPPKESKP